MYKINIKNREANENITRFQCIYTDIENTGRRVKLDVIKTVIDHGESYEVKIIDDVSDVMSNYVIRSILNDIEYLNLS